METDIHNMITSKQMATKYFKMYSCIQLLKHIPSKYPMHTVNTPTFANSHGIFKILSIFQCFQPLWETVWQGTVMGWPSQAARRPRMPSPDYFSVVPTLMDPTLTSKYLMDLSILLYLKIQNIFYMYWSVLFWHYRYHVNICNNVNCYTYYDSYQMYIL